MPMLLQQFRVTSKKCVCELLSKPNCELDSYCVVVVIFIWVFPGVLFTFLSPKYLTNYNYKAPGHQILQGLVSCHNKEIFSRIFQTDQLLMYLPHTFLLYYRKVQKCSKVKGKCMGEVHQNMAVEYLNLCGVLPHLKPWRLIC